jgi:periplasmic divalent cation tolerance protein
MTAPADLLVVLCTCPDEAVATRIATALVEQGLAACVNRVPGVRSLYRWAGQLQDDAEVLLAIKTTADRYDQVEGLIAVQHPYELPEVLALPVVAGSVRYMDWVRQATQA